MDNRCQLVVYIDQQFPSGPIDEGIDDADAQGASPITQYLKR
jgi:hypothetical protein